MPNVNRPGGLSPVNHLSGANWNAKGHVYYIPSDSGEAFYPGDLVKLTGESSTHGVPAVQLGTAGATAVGAVMALGVYENGPWINPDALDTTSAPATKTKAYYALVEDDPNAIFEIQEIGTGTLLTAAAVGLNADIVYGAPSGISKLSGTMLNNVGEAVTSTLNLKILRLAPRIDNVLGQYQKWWVRINNHSFCTGIAGI